MTAALRHTGIVVQNLNRMLEFYTSHFGCSVSRQSDERGDYLDNMLALDDVSVMTVKLSVPGGGMLEFLKFSNPDVVDTGQRYPNDSGITHVAFTVDNLDQTYGSLVSDGVKFMAPPQLSPDGAAKVTFCRDPEGNLLELVEVLLN